MRSTLLAALCAALIPASAGAFCGFYAGGGGAELFNNATQVVLMREGTKTVLSMQNNYQGPAEKFALVIPVPVVLRQEDVKTLPADVFERIDQLDAPRLVEYWEQDPCDPGKNGATFVDLDGTFHATLIDDIPVDSFSKSKKIKTKFSVAEYDFVMLSATESSELEKWLRENNYNIPEEAESFLRPYVDAGMKFLVVKINPKWISSHKKQLTLPPIRISYDAETFSLPVRLGLLNSSGTQDLIIHILAKEQYKVENYKNVTVPANLELIGTVRHVFPSFYVSLFDDTLNMNPGSVVTEYVWPAFICNNCPRVGALGINDFLSLGGDVVFHAEEKERVRWIANEWKLTRLHARYSKESLGDDFIFTTATPANSFEGVYSVHYPWNRKIRCKTPQRWVWGGPTNTIGSEIVSPAQNLASVPRGLPVQEYITDAVVMTGNYLGVDMPPRAVTPPAIDARTSACTATPHEEEGAGWLFWVLGVGWVVARWRRSPR